MSNLIAGCLCIYLYLYGDVLVFGLLSKDTCTLLLMNCLAERKDYGILSVWNYMYLSDGIWKLSNRNYVSLFRKYLS